MHAKSVLLCGAAFFAPSVFSQSLKELSSSFENLASRVRPAVVQIFSTGYVTGGTGEGAAASSLLSTQRSTGSGVILSTDGYIVTNNHVVQGARKIEVVIHVSTPEEARNARVSAKVIGTDREGDLAVIKIDRANLPYLGFGDSNSLRQGQLVMAFGNPLGLEGSVSMGVISSTSRRLHEDDATVFVQTDAPINPGNSGGPLIDTEGRVVGINTFIFTQSGGSEGLGFAIPSNVVQHVYDAIRKDGHVHRGQIGIVAQTITPVLAMGLGLPRDWGVIAGDVIPDGAADKAGLKPADIILRLNGKPLQDASQLDAGISAMNMDDKIRLAVLREGQELEYSVSVREREDDQNRFMDLVNPDDNLIPKLGILGIEISEKIAEKLPELRHEFGIVVAARSANPPYTGGALEVGDVIFEINRTPAVTVKALRTMLDEVKPGGAVVLHVQRNDKLVYVALEFE